MREPRPHQGVIPFPGIQRRILRTPAEGFQPTGEVVRMVAHAKRHQNHGADTPERPALGVKARLEGTLLEDRQPALPLLNAQAGRPPRNRACLQAAHSTLVLVELSSPCADGHPADTQAAGHGSIGELTGLEQPSSFQTSFLTWATGELSWAPYHGYPV